MYLFCKYMNVSTNPGGTYMPVFTQLICYKNCRKVTELVFFFVYFEQLLLYPSIVVHCTYIVCLCLFH